MFRCVRSVLAEAASIYPGTISAAYDFFNYDVPLRHAEVGAGAGGLAQAGQNDRQ